MRRTTILAILALGGSVAPLARADARALAPAGGGLPALEVRVDLAGGVVEANEARLPIGLDRARLPAEKDVVVESVAIGAGRHVVHVRIPEKGDADIAWEAILAAGPPRGLFAGTTGLVDGDPGERTGKAVQILPNGPTSFVLIGDIREDLELCGERVTLIDPVALYPGTLALRPATVQRLSAERLASAQRIVAKGKGGALDPALSRLLVSRGSSVAGSRGAELTDGDVQTVWSETRPGAGQGEFVVMAAPKDVPIAKIELAALPPGTRSANRAAPETFYIATTTELFEVALPQEAWLVPGESFEVEFPHPVATSCLAVVLGTAQPHTIAHPQVGIAEVVAYSEFDVPGATLTDVAKRLSGDRRTAAAQVLERAGPAALAAVERAYDELDAPGRALAMDVAAASERCDEAATLLARGLCDKTGEAPRKAREKLERCKGAAPVLAERLREDASTRACVAPTLAAIAPEEALEPIADVLGALPVGEKETRAALRAAFALALQSAPAGRLATLLADRRRAATARLEIMRAAQGRLAEAPAESLAVLAELLRGAPPERLRYLAIGPLEELARAGQPAAMDEGPRRCIAACGISGRLLRSRPWRPARARRAAAPAAPPHGQAARCAVPARRRTAAGRS